MRPKNIILVIVLLLLGFNIQSQTFQDEPNGENEGDFPSKWDLIKGSAQITSFEGSRVIQISNKGIITPLLNTSNYLADSFTLEFDAYFDEVRKAITYQYYPIRFWSGNGVLSLSATGGHYGPFNIFRHGVRVSGRSDRKTGFKHNNLLKNLESKEALWRHVKVAYSNQNLKIYIENTLVLNLPRLEFKPSMVSIGAVANQYNVEFVRVIKNVRLNSGIGTSSTSDDSNNTTDDETVVEEQISAISVGEGGLSTVLNSDSLEPVDSEISTNLIDDIVYAEMIRQNLPGMAIGVYKKGVIDYTKGYGHIDINRTIPITENTILRWASISKTITAVVALRLDEQSDSFSINDRVTEHYRHWISKFDGDEISDKANKNNISIRNLLNNRSGISHYTRDLAGKIDVYPNSNSTYSSPNSSFNGDSAVDIFRTADLVFEPNDTYMYSSNGFTLLGAVIDKVYSDGYPKYVKKIIKDKLGMSTLKISVNPKYKGFRKSEDGILEEWPLGSKESVLPAGGWESNVQDLLKFAKGILDEKLLINTENLWKDDGNTQKNINGVDVPQTYKRGILSSGSDTKLEVWHGGSHGNLTTLLYIIPNEEIVVVIMIPVQSADRMNIMQRIVSELGFPMGFTESPRDKCVAGMKSTKKKFVGLWKKTGDEINIRRGYTTTNFNKEWKFLSSKGYHLTDFETFNSDDGKLLWEGIFKKGAGKYGMWRNYDFIGFKNKWDEMRQQGFILYDLETYLINGQQRWAGLFEKKSGINGIWRNLSTTEFANKRDEMETQGKKLIDIEVISIEASLKWSGVWISGPPELLNRGSNYNDFRQLVRERNGSGYNLVDIETYKVNGVQKWTGIWEKNNEEQRFSSNMNYCSIMNNNTNYSTIGFELVDFENYED